MKKNVLFFGALLLCAPMFAQDDKPVSPVVLGVDIGSGIGTYVCCPDMWGFFTVAGSVERRFRPFFSVEATLRYSEMEGRLGSASFNSNILEGFHKVHSTSLVIGPKLHLSKPGKHSEWSLTPKGGLAFMNNQQEIYYNQEYLQKRTYKLRVALALELGLRYSYWVNDRLAMDVFGTYLITLDPNGVMTIKSESGQPIPPEASDLFPSNFFNTIVQMPNEIDALNIGLGFRYRL